MLLLGLAAHSRLVAHSSHHLHTRNNWYKSGSLGLKYQTRRLQWLDRGGDGGAQWRPIEWSAVTKLFEMNAEAGLVFGQLKQKHVFLTSKVRQPSPPLVKISTHRRPPSALLDPHER